MGLPPSDKPVTFVGVGVTRTSEGKIVETCEYYDALGLMQQLGVVPHPCPRLLARMLISQSKKPRSRLARREERI